MTTLTLKDGKSLNESRRKTFIIGFETASTALIQLSRQLFENCPDVKYILSYKLSQDHIETLFSRIRSRCGFNNNPDVDQFRAALKALLVKSEITPSSNANCLELEESNTSGSVQLFSRKRRNPVDDEEIDVEVDLHADEAETIQIPALPNSVIDIVQYIGKILYSVN